MSRGRQVFLLSPANCAGKRAGFLLRGPGRSALAQRLRAGGTTIGEVFTFMSGLYFRGKLGYAEVFADPPAGCAGVQVIVPGLGLRPAGDLIDLAGLRAVARVPVDPGSRRFVNPLRRDAVRLAQQLAAGDIAVLLGSIATPKYIPPLREALGPHLHVPHEFVGLGEMQRGSLMLRCAAERRELGYIGVAEAWTPADAGHRA